MISVVASWQKKIMLHIWPRIEGFFDVLAGEMTIKDFFDEFVF